MAVIFNPGRAEPLCCEHPIPNCLNDEIFHRDAGFIDNTTGYRYCHAYLRDWDSDCRCSQSRIGPVRKHQITAKTMTAIQISTLTVGCEEMDNISKRGGMCLSYTPQPG